MEKLEFAKALTFISAGIGKPVAKETIEVYFKILGDLPYDAFLAGCESVLVNHVWNSFPSIAELRQATLAVMTVNQLTAGEAFAMATTAAARIDMDIVGPYRVKSGDGWKEYSSQAEAVLDSLPSPVAKAMRTFGLHEICDRSTPSSIVRAQFTRVFEQLVEREKSAALLPPSVREFLERKPTPKAAIETERDSELIRQELAGIGGMPR